MDIHIHLSSPPSLQVSSSGSGVPRENCTPNCDGKNSGVMVADPLNCHQFYFCLGDNEYSETPYSCPTGMMFEEDTCVQDEGCDPECGKRELCHYECVDVKISKIADPYDCTIYSRCLTGGGFIKCPAEKPFFDGHACQTDEGRCCSCNPYCWLHDIYLGHSVIDKIDCKKHYLCEAIGIPEYASTCSTGNTDILSGICSDTAPCVTLCVNVVGPDGCIDIYTCKEEGYFAKCKGRCEPEYYHCADKDIGNIIGSQACQAGTVFHPGTHLCVSPSECPHRQLSNYTNHF